MKRNMFDQAFLDGYDFEIEDGNLGGLFDSIKKTLKKVVSAPISLAKKSIDVTKKSLSQTKDAVVKVVKTADQIHNTIHKGAQQILPPKIRKAIEKVEDDPRFKKIHNGVKVAVASYYMGPIAGKVFGAGIGSAVATVAQAGGAKATLGKTIASTVGSGLLNEGVKSAVAQKLKLDAKNAFNKATAENAELVAQLSRSPQYAALVADMRLKGLDNNAIAEMWRTSDVFKTLATAGAIKQVEPLYTDAYVTAGVPPPLAEKMGASKALVEAENEVKKVSQTDFSKVALLAIPLLFAALGG